MKLLVIDDHQLVRDGLRLAFSASPNQHQLELVEADSHEAALRMLAAHSDISIVLLDLQLSSASSWDLLREIVRSRPMVQIAILSASRDALDIERALRAGASGFISKEESIDGLRKAVMSLVARERYISPTLGYIPDEILLRSSPSGTQNAALSSLQKTRCREFGMTDREIQVFERALAGQANKMIAGELAINENTVKAHLSSVYTKLGVRSRIQALALFLK